jgi:hypothetical protein
MTTRVDALAGGFSGAMKSSHREESTSPCVGRETCRWRWFGAGGVADGALGLETGHGGGRNACNHTTGGSGAGRLTVVVGPNTAAPIQWREDGGARTGAVRETPDS